MIAEAYAKDAAAAAEEIQAALQAPLGLRVLMRSARCTVATTLHRGSGAPASL